MTLGEHFREFRRRLFIAAASVPVASIVAGIFYDQVFDFCPRRSTSTSEANPQSTISLNFGEATSALSNLISLSIFVGVLVSSPVWLYQIWAFIVPGLTRKEKRISLGLHRRHHPAVPARLLPGLLHPAAVALDPVRPEPRGHVEHPAGVDVLLVRHPVHPRLRPGFLFPVVLVGLNTVGVMPATRLIKGWRVAVVLIFVFAAVATPTADPFTMFVFAAPLMALYFGAWFVCRILDKRKARRRPTGSTSTTTRPPRSPAAPGGAMTGLGVPDPSSANRRLLRRDL